MSVKGEQAKRLEQIIVSARKIRTSLQHLLDKHGERVHFRPASKGIAMIGLLHERPQRGKSSLTKKDFDRLAKDFDGIFAAHCEKIERRKPTGEKQLQSFLIRESYRNRRRIDPINLASKEPVELHFVTDEIALPLKDGGKIVCDLLALRRDRGRCTPVLLELKDDRMQKRLAQQVKDYSKLVDDHAGLFAQLFGALLGEDIVFDGPTEKWIVWPAEAKTDELREKELASDGIRVVTYEDKNKNGKYTLRVGRHPH